MTLNTNAGRTCRFLQEHENWIVITYCQLLVWGKSRDFGVDLQLVEVVGLPTDLIVFARALQGVPVGSLPGPKVVAPKSLLQEKRTNEQM